MNRQPLIRIAVEEVEDVLDKFRARAADGVLCHSDQAALLAELQEALDATIAADEAQALGIAEMRMGPASQRVRRLQRSWDEGHAA